MREVLIADHFHNGRTPEQLQASFANSYATCLAYHRDQLIGTVRALSDGVCNAYIVDVWTLSAFRRQGVATKMMELVLAQLTGQHVYLFTDKTPSCSSLFFVPSWLCVRLFSEQAP